MEKEPTIQDTRQRFERNLYQRTARRDIPDNTTRTIRQRMEPACKDISKMRTGKKQTGRKWDETLKNCSLTRYPGMRVS